MRISVNGPRYSVGGALATELHAEHSVRWTTGRLSDHKAILIDRDLLNKVRNASTTVTASTSLPLASFQTRISRPTAVWQCKRLFQGAAHQEEGTK
jgi:hypothetical protein